MCKKILSLLIILTVSFSTSYTAIAAPQDKNINENKVKYQELNDKIGILNSQIATLNGEIEGLNSKLQENKKDIDSTEDQIKETEKQLEQNKKEVEEGQEVLGKRLRGIYKNELASNYLAILLSSENVSDLLNKITAINKIVSLDNEMINKLNEKQKALNKNINDLNTKQKELVELKKSTEDSIEEIDTKKAEGQKYLCDLNKEKEEVASIIEKNEEELISYSVNTINTSSNIDELKKAIATLKEVLPQLDMSSVTNKAKNAISKGNNKIQELQNTTPAVSYENNTVNRGESGFKKTMTVEATAYSGHSITATGLKPVRNPSGLSSIAVDPRVIPLGSKVYIPGYGYAIASDTGGAIKGNIIDLYMNSSEECRQWGRRNVTLHIVAYPNEW